LLSTTGRADTPAEYAASMPMTAQGGEALQRVELPVALYANVQHADLRDVRVFNAAGELVPYALIQRCTAAASPSETFSPPIFPVGRCRASASVNSSAHTTARRLAR